MCLIRVASCLLIWVALPIVAEPPQAVVEDAVSDSYRPLVFDQEKLAGLFARRMRANSEGFLEHVEDPGLGRKVNGSGTTPSLASFSSGGKYLEAIATAYQYRRDEHLRGAMARAAKRVMAEQANVSYSPGAISDKVLARSALLAHGDNILGLVAYYRLTNDDAAMTAARKLGDQLLKLFPDRSADASPNRDATTLIEPFVILYRYTEESRYLDFCRWAAEPWVSSKERHLQVSADNFSTLNGLVDLYRVTGDASYFRPVRAAWMDVRNNSLSITGYPLSNSIASATGADKNEGEDCTTLAWLQLTLNLLRITGEPEYAERLEHTIYNQLLAAQDATTGAIMTATPLNGSKVPASASDACAASESIGLALIPAAVWGRYGNGIAILLYSAGRATFQLSHRRGTVQLYSEAAFPENGDLLLHVEPAHSIRFPLRLRVPEWTSSYLVDVAGSHLVGKPGDYLTINREWKPGDTVRVSMAITARVLSGPPTGADEIAVQRGPQVLALPKALNPQVKDLAAAMVFAEYVSGPRLAPVASGLPSNWLGEQAYTIPGEYQGRTQQLILAPFADAKTYQVWLKRSKTATASIQ